MIIMAGKTGQHSRVDVLACFIVTSVFARMLYKNKQICQVVKRFGQGNGMFPAKSRSFSQGAKGS
jgi:hypothetical protein